MTLHELLWNASHGSLMDARDMQRFVQVRDVHGQLGPASVQEETATENLVRKLASLSGATAQ